MLFMNTLLLKRLSGALPRTFLPCLFFAAQARALIPEPSDLVYGSIVVSNLTITAANSNVVVEARTSVGGGVVASYMMGSDTNAGDFYSLTLGLENGLPLADTNSLVAGQMIYLTVHNATNVLAQVPYIVPTRGGVQRVDFGSINPHDANPLPVAWQLAYFGRTGVDPNADPDHDGRSNLQEFFDGTNPNVADSGFVLSYQPMAGKLRVMFLARTAAGPGYDNLTRSFTLQYSTNLSQPWQAVAGYSDIPGFNQKVYYDSPVTAVRTFFRGVQQLQ